MKKSELNTFFSQYPVGRIVLPRDLPTEAWLSSSRPRPKIKFLHSKVRVGLGLVDPEP